MKLDTCDNCGKTEAEHVTLKKKISTRETLSGWDERDVLMCPDVAESKYPSEFAYPAHIYTESEWLADGHKVHAVLDQGLRLAVTCPGEGKCQGPLCEECETCNGRGYDAEDEECETCEGRRWTPIKPFDCWVKEMAGQYGPEFEEWSTLRTETTLPTEIVWTSVGFGEDAEIRWRPR